MRYRVKPGELKKKKIGKATACVGAHERPDYIEFGAAESAARAEAKGQYDDYDDSTCDSGGGLG